LFTFKQFSFDQSLKCSGLPHPGKVLDFFAALESPEIFYKSWKVLENIWEVYRDRIVKLLSLIISTKIRYMKE